MEVHVGRPRNTDVHDVSNAFDVEASGEHVGSDQHFELPLRE
eukprot:CAMPEP_0167798920 /NCGR_PEP_ID=MMETSP0111_2-20121227/16655_1 /TAXON_ID=91324 /ORGANISM="Lotharella globosa, Strain CCCM811" /LENGTH=41 /DNA_ID= /DNA_START= /DNA_END= /DNA_ORIENTATION=